MVEHLNYKPKYKQTNKQSNKQNKQTAKHFFASASSIQTKIKIQTNILVKRSKYINKQNKPFKINR